MVHDYSELTYFYRQLGVDVTDEQDKPKKNRSQNFSFGLILEDCACSPDTVTLEMALHTPYGSRVIRQHYPFGGTDDEYLHQHDYYELMYVRSGTMNVSIETSALSFHAGDLILINRFSRHLELYDQDNRVVYLCISKALAQDLASDLKNYPIPKELYNFLYQNTEREDPYTKVLLRFRQVCEDTQSIADRLVEKMVAEMSGRLPGYLYVVKALLLRLFLLVSDSGNYIMQAKNKEGSPKDRIFDAVRTYIIDHNGILVRSELEKQLHFHADYLNKLVKSRTGMSLVRFAQSYRMKEAARLIRSSDKPITQVCQELGFSNKAHFYRLFYETYHMTPAEYRQFSKMK